MVATIEIGLIQHRGGESSTIPDSLERNEIGIAEDTGEAFFGAPNNPLVRGRARSDSNQYPYENIRLLTEFTDNLSIIRHAFKGSGSFLQYPTIVQSNKNIPWMTYPGAGPDTVSVTANGTVSVTINNGDSLGTIAQAFNTSLQAGLISAAANVQLPITSVDPVRVATTGSGTIGTDFEAGDTVDGVVLAAGDRILLKDQATAAENGIYAVQLSGIPTRVPDADSALELTDATCYVREGTVNSGRYYRQILTINVVGTDGQTWTQTSGRLRLVSSSGYDIAVNNTAGTPLQSLEVIDGSYTSAGQLSRSLQQTIDDRISAKMFGAIGDGVSDDSSMLNTGIQSLFCSGDQTLYRELFLPAGTYVLSTDSIYLAPNTRLRGEGPGRTRIYVGTGSAFPAVRTQDLNAVYDTSGSFDPSPSTRPKNIHVQDLTIEHADDFDLVELTASENVKFENVEFKTSGTGTAILVKLSANSGVECNRIEFLNSSFTTAAKAFALTDNPDNVLIKNSTFSDIGSRILEASGTSNGIQFVGNLVLETANNNPSILLGSGVTKSRIDSNQFEFSTASDPTVIRYENASSGTDYEFGPVTVPSGSTVALQNITLSSAGSITVDYRIKGSSSAVTRSGVVQLFHDTVSSGVISAAPDLNDTNPLGSGVFTGVQTLGTEDTMSVRIQNTTGSDFVIYHTFKTA